MTIDEWCKIAGEKITRLEELVEELMKMAHIHADSDHWKIIKDPKPVDH